MNRIRSITAATAVTILPISIALADGPPVNAKPMVEIVEKLERHGYGPFTELDIDDGFWEIEVYKNNTAYELTVNQRTGKILSEHRDDTEPYPPKDALPLSKILHGLHKAGYANIKDASFERRYWEIEAYRENGKHELHVDPSTGEVVSDRRDD